MEKKCSVAQADGMARFSKVPITPEQKDMYASLRETAKKSDQELMAQVIGLTDVVVLGIFMQAYPKIFELKSS